MCERKEVTVFPSFWWVLVAMVFIMYFIFFQYGIDKTNEKLDTLIKLEQQAALYRMK